MRCCCVEYLALQLEQIANMTAPNTIHMQQNHNPESGTPAMAMMNKKWATIWSRLWSCIWRRLLSCSYCFNSFQLHLLTFLHYATKHINMNQNVSEMRYFSPLPHYAEREHGYTYVWLKRCSFRHRHLFIIN